MPKLKAQKVFVALSGGVDSSVAAWLLKERGFDVYGVHIKMWGLEGSNRQPATGYQYDVVCRQQYQDRLDAMAVAAKLDIPFETWDFTENYHTAVVRYMIREYAVGRTPNPDIMCNRYIKFGIFLKKALERGADYIATGHYVRLRSSDTNTLIHSNDPNELFVDSRAIRNWCRLCLLQAKDKNKDQSYFLWTLTQERLRHCLFPIGDYTKSEVREMARKSGLPTAEKRESQGLCFVGKINVRDFLKTYIPEERGAILTTAGKTIGEHPGIQFYTVGQRHGLGIGGGIPYYVAKKDCQLNTLVVVEGRYDEKLFLKEVIATDMNWISGQEPKLPFKCLARIRYRQPVQKCAVKLMAGSRKPEAAKLKVTFSEAQRAVSPGQSIVFYQKRSPAEDLHIELLGGGIIA